MSWTQMNIELKRGETMFTSQVRAVVIKMVPVCVVGPIYRLR